MEFKFGYKGFASRKMLEKLWSILIVSVKISRHIFRAQTNGFIDIDKKVFVVFFYNSITVIPAQPQDNQYNSSENTDYF